MKYVRYILVMLLSLVLVQTSPAGGLSTFIKMFTKIGARSIKTAGYSVKKELRDSDFKLRQFGMVARRWSQQKRDNRQDDDATKEDSSVSSWLIGGLVAIGGVVVLACLIK